MKRHLWSMSLIGLTLLALAQCLYAEDWVCKGGDVDCLRNAIKEANGNGEANTVTLEAGSYILTTADPATEGEESGVVVNGRLVMIGAGDANTFIERKATAASRFRVMEVTEKGSLRVEGLTIRGGAARGDGGGILNRGELQLHNSAVEKNTAAGGGGGLAVVDDGKALLWGTIVARNTAEGPGPACVGPVISLGNNIFDYPCTPTPRADDLTLVPEDYSADLLSQPSGTGGTAVASSRFAFATSKASGRIYGFTIDASGRMSANGSVAACNGPVGLAIDHTRQWLWAACADKLFQVVGFKIDANGQLTRQQQVVVDGAPSAVAVAPSNFKLYVTKSLALPVVSGPDHVSYTLQQYTINQKTGLLTFDEEQRTQGADPDAVVSTPQGDFVLVANTTGNDIKIFRANPFTGGITAAGGLTLTGRSPTSLAFTPQGDLLMVGCERDGVYMYALDHSSGQLTLVDHRGSFAAGVGVSPDGSSAIVTWWDQPHTVTAYTIDYAAKKLVLRQTIVDTGGEPSTHNGSVQFKDSATFYVANIRSQGNQPGNVQRYTMDRIKVTAQEYLSAGLQTAALAIAK
jgi:6-phosphogluconolactonase (cycloisomerase 2 family)